MKVLALMSTPVISVKADSILPEIVQLIDFHQINSVPVINANEEVIGMIGSRELFPKGKSFRSPDLRIPVLFKQIVDIKYIINSYKELTHVTAKDIMSPSPACVDVNDEINQVLWMMVEKDLHTIPVLRSKQPPLEAVALILHLEGALLLLLVSQIVVSVALHRAFPAALATAHTFAPSPRLCPLC
jgi:CBS-domain-containing membrane protein